MKLHLSFDLTDVDKAIDIAQQVESYVSAFDIGSLLLYKNGIIAVERFKEKFPHMPLIVDAKIIEHGKDSVTLLAQAGANWITVMAGAHKDTIHSACNTAHKLNAKIILDLLDATSYGQSALEAQSLGADALLIHTSYDESERLVFEDQWNMVRGNTSLPIFLSGKISPDSLEPLATLNPDGVFVGRAIIQSENPVATAKLFYDNLVIATSK